MRCEDRNLEPDPQVGPRDVLRIYNAGADALRADHDLPDVLPRLRLLAKLGTAASWPGPAPWDMTGEAAAVATFLARAQPFPALYEWARGAVWQAGLNPLDLVDRAAAHPGPVPDPYVRPVTEFQPTPACYELLAIADLPYSHGLHCSATPEQDRLIALHGRRARRRNLWRAPRPGAHRAVLQAAGRDLQERLNDGRHPPCGLHVYIDWDLAAEDAERIRCTVRPWTRTAVGSACSALRPNHMDPHTELLRKLFLDPVRLPPGATEVGGGQHTVCRARQGGATTLMVATAPSVGPVPEG